MNFSEQLMHSTVRIEIVDDNSNILSTGTGFFFDFNLNIENIRVPVLVTNKHVIKNARFAKLVFTISDDENNPVYGENFKYLITNFESSFILHPDEEIDICILPMAIILTEAKKKYNKKIFITCLPESSIPTSKQIQDFSVLENVIMIGYPNGLWDSTNNLPIIRRGVTAIHPKFDYNNKSDIVIDIACFPGSSGSPICIYDEGSYRSGNILIAGGRVLLIGVLYAGPIRTVYGKIQTVTIPTSINQITTSNHMINIGYAIKSQRLLDFKPILEKKVKEQILVKG